jgi:transcriptional regulator with XRE-family HTH domain
MGQARRPLPERLPAKLLQIRTQLGLTQEQMADRLKRIKSPPQPGMISRYETGQREPTLLVLLEYARIAGVSMEVLVDDSLYLPKKLPANLGRDRAGER